MATLLSKSPAPKSPATPDSSSSLNRKLNDLGFGNRVGEVAEQRFLNRDGSFNIRRIGLPRFYYTNYFHSLMTTTWPRLFLLITAVYITQNVLFGFAYFSCGPGALQGGSASSTMGRFDDCFFFSVHTLATIGYGTIHPVGLAANMLVTLEALVGLVTFALVTGIIFARFSRPVARLRFSKHALIAPYRGGRAFEFRVINTSSSQLVEMGAKVIFTRGARPGEGDRRVYEQLKLEREVLTFFPLQWTVVHPIDENSPMHELTDADLRQTGAEFIILLTGIEETFSQQVHTRTSYRAEEIVWDARFKDMYSLDGEGVVQTDVCKLDDWERVEAAAGVNRQTA